MSTAPLNPFREPTEAQRTVLAQQRALSARARKRAERILAAYREMLTDARYAPIQDELTAALGENLHLLLETARKCPACAPIAVRVDALNDVVARPLHQAFQEAQQSRVEPSIDAV